MNKKILYLKLYYNQLCRFIDRMSAGFCGNHVQPLQVIQHARVVVHVARCVVHVARCVVHVARCVVHVARCVVHVSSVESHIAHSYTFRQMHASI